MQKGVYYTRCKLSQRRCIPEVSCSLYHNVRMLGMKGLHRYTTYLTQTIKNAVGLRKPIPGGGGGGGARYQD